MMNHVHVTIERVRIGEYICYRILREYTDSTADDTTENKKMLVEGTFKKTASKDKVSEMDTAIFNKTW